MTGRMTMITGDYDPLPLLSGLATMIATTMADSLRNDDPDRILQSLIAVANNARHASLAASDDMDDDTLTTPIERMTDDQIGRLRDQGTVAAGLRMAHLALGAMADDFAEAHGVTIEHLELD